MCIWQEAGRYGPGEALHIALGLGSEFAIHGSAALSDLIPHLP
jgi:hypothetical protein